MTIQHARRYAHAQLTAASDAPHLDAERLLLHVLARRETAWLYAHGEEELTNESVGLLAGLIARRRAGEPLAYILGEWEFYGRPFFVTPAVLIPRPSTEGLVEATLEYLNKPSMLRNIEERDEPLVIADVGTGSGCVAVSLALESRIKNIKISIIATDISAAALAVARRNAARYGVMGVIEFLHGNMLEPLHDRRVDWIVSNPPYVPCAELDNAGARQDTLGLTFEPRMALDGGSDGLRYIHELRQSSQPVLLETQGGGLESSFQA